MLGALTGLRTLHAIAIASPHDFTFFADDSGQPAIRPSTTGERYSFVFGGFVVRNADIARMRECWRAFKLQFFGNEDSEVKAQDLVAAESPIPDIREDLTRRDLLQGALAYLLHELQLRPVACILDKADVPDLFTTKTKAGGATVDKTWPFLSVAMQFGVFLRKVDALGCFVCDDPGQGSEAPWRDKIDDLVRQRPDVGARITQVTFVRSHSDEGVQLADVVAGLLRYQHERRELVRAGLGDALQRAMGDGLGLFHVHA